MYTVKTFGLLQTLFQLPQLHVCGVCIMRLKDCFQSSEDLETKINRSPFQKTNQLPILEKAWLHSYHRNASNAHVAKIGLLKDKIMKKLLDGIKKQNILEAFLGLLIMIPLWCNWDNLKIWLEWPFLFSSVEFITVRVCHLVSIPTIHCKNIGAIDTLYDPYVHIWIISSECLAVKIQQQRGQLSML